MKAVAALMIVVGMLLEGCVNRASHKGGRGGEEGMPADSGTGTGTFSSTGTNTATITATSIGTSTDTASDGAEGGDEYPDTSGDAQYVDTRDSAALTDDQVDTDVAAYAVRCKAELGITTPLPDLSCLAGVEVPITVDGKALDTATFAALRAGTAGCDKAQWLDGACWTYALVQRVRINPEVEAVLNCRQKFYSSALSPSQRIAAYEAAVARGAPSGELVRLYGDAFEFDDLGFILRSRTSGKTCYFTFFGDRSKTYFGGWIAAPDKARLPTHDEVLARLPAAKPPPDYPEARWYKRPVYFSPTETAAGGCVGCHDQGAFKHSPFIDQAHDARGRIVPANDRALPYLPVGRTFQKAFRDARIFEVAPTSAAAAACVSCHRLTSSTGGAAERVDWAVGIGLPQPSRSATTWPARSWMPPGHGHASQAAYDTALGTALAAIRCCAADPDAYGCRKRAFGPTTAEVGSWITAPPSTTRRCP